MRLVLAFVLATSLGAPATAQETGPDPDDRPAIPESILMVPEEIVAALREIEHEPTFARLADNFGIPENLRPLFAAHYREIFANDAVAADYAAAFAGEQVELGAASRPELADIARSLAVGWAQDTATLGAPRLSAADQRALLLASLATLLAMPADACAASTRGALDPTDTARAEIAWLASIDPVAVAAHLARSRAAILAEITDDPPFEPLPEDDERRAGRAYQEAVLAGIDAHPLKPLVLEAVENFDLAPDEAVCELARLSLRAALKIRGETGDLVVRLVTSG